MKQQNISLRHQFLTATKIGILLLFVFFQASQQTIAAPLTNHLQVTHQTVVSRPASELERFFKNTAIEAIAAIAHPGKTMTDYSLSIYGETAYLTIYFQNASMRLRIEKNGNCFTTVRVLEDSCFFAPWILLEVIKDTVNEADPDRKFIPASERILRKTVSVMDGADLMCVLLTIMWGLR